MSNKKELTEKDLGLEIAPKATENWQELLYTKERKAAVERGEMSLKDYHAISPPEMLQMALIGFRMYEQGKYREAKTVFSGLIQLDPQEAYYHTALGAVFLAEEELEMARAYFDTAIAINPKEVAPFVNRGEVNLRDGKILEAAEDFAKAVQLDPEFKDPLTQRARVLAAAALEMIESASKEDGGGKKEAPRKDAPRKDAPKKDAKKK